MSLTTDFGTTTRWVDYTTYNRNVLKGIKLDANITDSALEIKYPSGMELAATKISISTSTDGDFNYQPSSPISIKSGRSGLCV